MEYCIEDFEDLVTKIQAYIKVSSMFIELKLSFVAWGVDFFLLLYSYLGIIFVNVFGNLREDRKTT